MTSLKIGGNPLKELGPWAFTALKILTDLDIQNITTLSSGEIKVSSEFFSTTMNIFQARCIPRHQ